MNEEEQNIGQLDDVFSDDKTQTEKDEIDVMIEGIGDDKTRYLTNMGKPSKVVVFKQRVIEWNDSAGRTIRVEVVLDGDDEEYVKKRKQYGIFLAEGEKAYINFINGKFQKIKKMYADHSFIDWNYPHVIGFPIGTNMANRRLYDFYINHPTPITNNTDFEILSKQLQFLVETDKNGNVLDKNNQYLKNLNVKPKKRSDTESINWNSMEITNNIPKHQDSAEPVKLNQDDSVKDE